MEQSSQNSLNSIFTRFPLFSLIAGICSLLACCSPPKQLLLGAFAIILARASRNGRPLSKAARFGLILGIFSVIISIFIFVYYMLMLRFMDDPANSELVREAIRQSQELIKYFQNSANSVPVN